MKATIFSILLAFSALFLQAQNLPPVAVNDTVIAHVGDTLYVNVLRNDYDPEGDSMFISPLFNVDSIIVVRIDERYYYYNTGIYYRNYSVFDKHFNFSYASIVIIFENPLYDSLHVNNINATFHGAGNHFYGHDSNQDRTQLFKVPNGSKIATIYNFVPWIAGLDDEGDLHVSADQYYGFGDFRPGPISMKYDSTYRDKWYRVWGISKNEIEYHKTHYLDPGYQADPVILNWPGNGDPMLGESPIIAPFQDMDHNGLYQPLEGDYPLISGDQAVFFIFNDDFYSEEGSNGIPLGIEVHGMAFAFDCPGDSALDNTIFMTQKVINRSDTNYHNLYLGFFTAWELGDPLDNRIGCDTALDAWFCYNGRSWDDTARDGYGHHPPSQGITFLNQNLDHYMLCLGGGISDCPWGNAVEYYNYLRSYWSWSDVHLKYGGFGMYGTILADHIFPDDPLDNLNGWTEITAAMSPYDRTSISSTGPWILAKDSAITIDLAFVYGRDFEGDHLTSIPVMKERVKQIRYYYENDSTPCGQIHGIRIPHLPQDNITVFPNPARDQLNISLADNSNNFEYQVIDVTGRIVLSGSASGGNNLDISSLNNGFYVLFIASDGTYYHAKFIKNNTY